MWLLLALTGCLTGSYYPSHEGWQLTASPDSGLPVYTPDIPCSAADQGTLAQLTVHNPTAQSFQLSYMDDACVEVYFATVGPQASWTDGVGNHLIWVVRDSNGGYVRYFGIPSGSSVSWVETLP
jgi:hypothetical protein